MIMRLILIAVLLCGPVFGEQLTFTQKQYAKKQAKNLRDELQAGDIMTLAGRTDQALDAVVAKAISELRNKNEIAFADQSESEWATQYHGFITRMVIMQMGSHDIGDHKPLIEWLAVFYNEIEAKLGVEVCKLLHLSDIKTFNFCIPVVFHPTSFPMDSVPGPRAYEYLRHCNQGSVYYGLLPVLTYWVVDIGCSIGTSGTGDMILCGLISGFSEVVMAKFFGVKLCEFIYTKSGGL